MGNRYGDPQVRAWMKEHEEEAKRIERLYDLMKDRSPEELAELALGLGIDVSRRRAQYRDALITDIVKAAPDSALKVLEGQAILIPGEGI
jgi:hypothetical protein